MAHTVPNQPAPISILGQRGTKRALTNDLTPPRPKNFLYPEPIKIGQNPTKASPLPVRKSACCLLKAPHYVFLSFALSKLSLLKYYVWKLFSNPRSDCPNHQHTIKPAGAAVGWGRTRLSPSQAEAAWSHSVHVLDCDPVCDPHTRLWGLPLPCLSPWSLCAFVSSHSHPFPRASDVCRIPWSCSCVSQLSYTSSVMDMEECVCVCRLAEGCQPADPTCGPRMSVHDLQVVLSVSSCY